MSMDKIDTRLWHQQYEDAGETVRGVIDDAFKGALAALKKHNYVCAGDDRAEMLVAAITQYVFTSRDH